MARESRWGLAVAAVAAILLFAGPGAARGAVVRTQPVGDFNALALKFEGDLRERNAVRVSGTSSGTVLFRDRGARRMVARAPGCRRMSRTVIRCVPNDAINEMIVDTLDEDDRIVLERNVTRRYVVTVDGSLGDDRIRSRSVRDTSVDLIGSFGDDHIVSDGADAIVGPAIYGGAGRDVIRVLRGASDVEGGSGDDRIAMFGRSVFASVDCGPGRDRMISGLKRGANCELFRRLR